MKKKMIQVLAVIGIFGSALSIFTKQAHAEIYEQTYESNSGVGFYGEYVFPEGSKPPDELEKPNEPRPEGPTDTVEHKPLPHGNVNFPQTGESKQNASSIGVIALIGVFLVRSKKIKQEKGETHE